MINDSSLTLQSEKVGSFSVLLTGDGSPSLRGDSEPMHHLGGAYSETQYIYGDALRRLQEGNLSEWRAVVVGLGLGYIELLTAAEALKHQKPFRLLSYELQDELVTHFLAWLQTDSPISSGINTAIDTALISPKDPSTESSSDSQESLEHLSVYDRMYQFFQRDYPELDLKAALLQAKQEGRWEIRGALGRDNLPTQTCHAILFDAFSGKSTPDLWTEEFLLEFLKSARAPEMSVFGTYACTGVLKRTLQAAGFAFQKRPGFLGKRDSTMAVAPAL